MPEYFQRPENALRKAHEFLDVGKLKPALEVLSDVLRSKKHRTWQKVHEPIIEQYLNLCVELRKSQAAKEGLYQYKIICQQVNTKSLEDAVIHYLNMAEQRTQAAREKSAVTALRMVEDLDMIESPEGMLLRAVTGEVTQDRTDRLLLTPWVKYLWESYRQCLDLLRNNSRVEKLYHNIAQRAFKFCLNYDRRTEFRKLCDNLRNHVKLSEQRHTAQFSVNLSNPETQVLHLETRIAQLDAAIQIELWQEAFKAVEDIHYLMSLSKRPPKPQTLANFNVKLSLVFWKAENLLFHACARHRLFHLTKDMKKNPSIDDLTRMASLMLVATLSIPISQQKHGIGKLLDMEQALIDKHLTLSKMLGLDRPPTRSSLIEEFLKFNLLQYVPRQLRELYQWLEVDFHPLRLSEKVATTLLWIKEQTREPELIQYVPHLEGIVVSRVLQQVSQVYQTISFFRLQKLIPFCSAFKLERVIVDAARNGQLQVRFNHNRGSLSFGTDLNASPLYVEDEFFETNRLQALPSERVSDRFNLMARALHEAHNKLNGDVEELATNKLQQQILSHYHKTAHKDHRAILQRKVIIEHRKERLEHINMEKEMKEQLAVQKQEEAMKLAEQQRLHKEQREREEKRKKEREKEEKRKNVTDRLEMMRKTDIGQKVLGDIAIEDFDDINPDELMKKQMENMEREKREAQDRLKAQERKVDYFERAKRIKEIPMYQQMYKKKVVKDTKLWNTLETQRIERLKKEQELALAQKQRLNRMSESRHSFMQLLRDTRRVVYEEKMQIFQKKLEEERATRLARRKAQRKEERRQAWYEEKAEEEQRRKDEELKRKREDEERLKREKEEAEKKEHEERMRILHEQEQKRKEKEAEIERKLEEQKRLAEKPSTKWASRDRRDEVERTPWRSREDASDRGPPRRAAKGDDNWDWRRGDRDVNQDRPQRPADSWGARRAPPRDASPTRGSWRRGSPPRDRPPARDFNRPARDFGGLSSSRDEGRSWRRSPSPRRASPAGKRRSPPPGRRFSPTGRRDSPPGRSPPPGRRRSPAGRKSSPPGRGGGAWKRDLNQSNLKTSGGDKAEDKSPWRSRAPPSDKPGPWRPSRLRTEQHPPKQADKSPSDDRPSRKMDDGEWQTVRR